MSRTKRTSTDLEKADLRLQSIKTLGATLDFGNGFSVAAFEAKIDGGQTILDEYNQLLALLDEKTSALREMEKQVADFSERMLTSVAAKYGKDSLEYAQAGGKRKSEIKHSGRKPASKSGGQSSNV